MSLNGVDLRDDAEGVLKRELTALTSEIEQRAGRTLGEVFVGRQ
jgi:hypothetical protein